MIHIEKEERFSLIHQREWDWWDRIQYLQKIRYIKKELLQVEEEVYREKGITGLSDLSKRPHNVKHEKITPEIEETILDLRLTKRFGCKRIKFRLKRTIGLSLSTRTIYRMLKRRDLNILKCQYRRRREYKCFEMKNPNDTVVQMTSLVLSIWVILVQGIISSAA